MKFKICNIKVDGNVEQPISQNFIINLKWLAIAIIILAVAGCFYVWWNRSSDTGQYWLTESTFSLKDIRLGQKRIVPFFLVFSKNGIHSFCLELVFGKLQKESAVSRKESLRGLFFDKKNPASDECGILVCPWTETITERSTRRRALLRPGPESLRSWVRGEL